jgi:hypothetical protein
MASMVSCYTLSHSAGLVDVSYLLIPNGLKFRGQLTLFKSREKALAPLHCILRLGNIVIGASHSKGHSNHGPFPHVVCAQRGLALGTDFQSGHVHLCCGEHRTNVYCPGLDRTPPGGGSDDVGRVPTWTPMVVRVLTRISSSQARVGSTIVGVSNIAWRCLTYTLTSSLSLGNKGVSWSMIILEGKALYAGVR